MMAYRAPFRDKLLQRYKKTALQPEKVEKHYKIYEKLGEGGAGTVHEVKHRSSGIRRAMKCLPFEFGEKDTRKANQELFNILETKPHIHIMKWFDIFVTPGEKPKLCIIMELCTMDLAMYCKQFFERPENSTKSLGMDLPLQITKAVAFLHQQDPDIIHRDIKPQNILVIICPKTNKVTVKIADFGMCTITDSDSSTSEEHISGATSRKWITTSQKRGTWSYMAPEFFEAMDHGSAWKFRPQPAVDIFALGLVFAYMFCFDSEEYGTYKAN